MEKTEIRYIDDSYYTKLTVGRKISRSLRMIKNDIANTWYHLKELWVMEKEHHFRLKEVLPGDERYETASHTRLVFTSKPCRIEEIFNDQNT
jgi:hypothetical protein